MITTERLLIRQWKKEDLEPLSSLHSDDRVMKFFPRLLSLEESHVFMEKCHTAIQEKGFGFWAVETIENSTFIGLVGLSEVYDIPYCHNRQDKRCVEIG